MSANPKLPIYLSPIHPPNTHPPQLWKRAGDIRAHLKRQSGPTTSWQIDGETVETVRLYFLGASKSLQMVTAARKLKDIYSLEGKL